MGNDRFYYRTSPNGKGYRVVDRLRTFNTIWCPSLDAARAECARLNHFTGRDHVTGNTR